MTWAPTCCQNGRRRPRTEDIQRTMRPFPQELPQKFPLTTPLTPPRPFPPRLHSFDLIGEIEWEGAVFQARQNFGNVVFGHGNPNALCLDGR